MKRKYLFLTILGTILPNIFVAIESWNTGNYFLYVDPISTFNGMFANNVSATFVTDLLFIVFLFLVWSYKEANRYKMKNIIWVWIYTFAFGIAGGLPLFLYMREKRKETLADHDTVGNNI